MLVPRSGPSVSRAVGSTRGRSRPAANATGTIGIVRDVATDDDADDDAPLLGSPLPPEDRLWRHPSEIGLAEVIDAPSTGGVRPWAVAVSGLAGAVLTLGLVAAFASIGPGVVERGRVERVPVTPVSFETFAADVRASRDSTAADRVGPAVVRVEAYSADATTIGSGVVFRDDGYVLTNAHLLTGALRVTLSLHDGREIEATVVGTDPTSDIAVLMIAGGPFTTAVLGSADELEVGEPAMVVGAAAGRGSAPAVAVGAITAMGRPVDTSAATLHDMIETDADVDPSSSGGALVDRFGVVVGIATDPAGPETGSAPPGLAIPIDLARAVADDIVETGHARRTWLGIEGADLDAGRAARLGLDTGALVSAVVADSPAADAGLTDGDVIVAVEGRPIATMSALVSSLRRHDPGDKVRVDYVRADRPASCEVTLADLAPPS